MIKPEIKRLYHFPGGLELEDNKKCSAKRAIKKLPVNKKLIVPLKQHIGFMPELYVQVGDNVKKGQIIGKAEDDFSLSTHAPSSGKVVAIEQSPIAHPSGLDDLCVHIETDGEDDWYPDYETINNYLKTPSMELRNYLRDMGVAGLGGAVFPTAVKLDPGPKRDIHTLIVNGAECEPYITCDDRLMQEQATQIIHGIKVVLHILNIDKCIIGIESNKPEAYQQMRHAVKGLRLDDQIEVVCIPTLYPSGSEKQLIKVLTNAEVPNKGIPADIGMVCLNVGTCYSIFQAIHQVQPVISRTVTLTGDGVKRPGNYEVLIGTPIKDFIAMAGGLSDKAERIIVGGPMMGFTLLHEQAPIVKSTNCIIVASKEECPEPQPEQNCIRCSSCVEVCPIQLLPQQLYWYAKAKNFDRIEEYHLFDCIECGCCAYVCPSHIPLVQYYRFAKSQIKLNALEKKKADHARKRHEFQEFRKEQAKKEREARMAKKRAALKAKAGDDKKKQAIAEALKRAQEKKRLKQQDKSE